MDQDSTNGSGPDKRNWRERLGIGAKEMPKLSDEFRDEAAKSSAGSETVRPAPPRGGQPVTSPAPMAPRAPKAQAAAASAPAAPSPSAPRATPRMPDNAAQEALAEKLRAQRAAAEKLAEQRVQAARDRAEGRTAEPPPATSRTSAAAPRTPPGATATKPRAPIPPPAGGRPKFSFAEEPAPGRDTRGAGEARPGLSGGAAAPLTPPRPALGADRGQPPFLRPSASGLGARTQPPYKPVDPSSPAGYGPPPRLQPPPTGRGGYGAEPSVPAYPGSRGTAPRRPPPALESYPRQDARDFAESEPEVPRLGRPAPRGRSSNDFDEVFEDDGGNRQRASARDYQSAYGESDAFAEDTRRSSGPWLLLLAILAAALVAGGAFWYYNTNMKNVAGSGTAAPGEVPVVNAPPEPSKVAPEAPTAATEEPAVQKKQIYDRIVGEQEVNGGQLQQTEETPVPPASMQPASEVPDAAGSNPIPAPDAPVQGTDSQGLPTVDEPPPLPLPPAGGEQGSLDNRSVERIAAASAQPEQGATEPPDIPLPDPSAASTTSSVSLLPPPPEKATDGAALVSDTALPSPSAAAANAAGADAAAATPAEAEAEAPPPPPKKKPQTASTKRKPQQQAAAKNLGAEPVVLVPPAEPALADTETASSSPVSPAPAEAAQAPEKKKRTIMDLFRASGGAAGSDDSAVPAETQVASVEPPAPSLPPSKQADAPPATGSGFVIQLASFRSEADARKEYRRLSSAYPSVIGGLQEQIRQTSVGGSTRYQLGLGPLPSRSQATKVCSQLITAGESDCIVRGR